MVCPCFVIYYLLVVSFLVLQSSCREEKAGCVTLIVSLVSCDCRCSVALPHGVDGWSAVYVFVVFSDQTPLLLGLKARLSDMHVVLPDVNVKV